VNNLLGIMTEQYAQAMAIAIALDLYCKSEGIELTFVGHSLGGGLAALSSMVTGRPAITYNPAAVMALPTLALEKIGRTCDDSNIYKYIMEGDYVTAGQEALGISAWGHRLDVHNSTPKDDAHSIYTMYNNLK
jgi:putative lipase involved disintegration of autophagic bodies